MSRREKLWLWTHGGVAAGVRRSSRNLQTECRLSAARRIPRKQTSGRRSDRTLSQLLVVVFFLAGQRSYSGPKEDSSSCSTGLTRERKTSGRFFIRQRRFNHAALFLNSFDSHQVTAVSASRSPEIHVRSLLHRCPSVFRVCPSGEYSSFHQLTQHPARRAGVAPRGSCRRF